MKNWRRLLIVISLIAIAFFTVVSAFGCFAVIGEYMIDYGLFTAGESFVEETRSNSFLAILILSITQISLLLSKKRWTRAAGVALSSIACLLTVVYKPLCDVAEGLMGGIIGYYCEITWLGYIAILLSVLIVLFQTALYVKEKR